MVPVPPVESVLNGPQVSVCLSGFWIVTVTPSHPRSSVANLSVIPMWISSCWLMPIGLGVAPIMGNVVFLPGSSCAVTTGKAISNADIVKIRINEIVDILVLIVFFFIF